MTDSPAATLRLEIVIHGGGYVVSTPDGATVPIDPTEIKGRVVLRIYNDSGFDLSVTDPDKPHAPHRIVGWVSDVAGFHVASSGAPPAPETAAPRLVPPSTVPATGAAAGQ